MLFRVGVLFEDRNLARSLSRHFADADVSPILIRPRRNILPAFGRLNLDLLVAELGQLPDPVSDALRLLNDLPETPGMVLITERENPARQAEYMALGCDAVLSSDLGFDKIGGVIRGIISKRRGLQLDLSLTGDLSGGARLDDFISASPAMQTFMSMVNRVVRTDSSLLILGETGVGKERLARAIHAESHRAGEPFIAINCAALPENLLESEIFGHERGAFTGATRLRRGAFELGHRGTVYLDEIGDMPLHLQVKLLRVLQEREFTRLGGEKVVKVDIRLMASTNRDLRGMVAAKTFREDLFFRLGVLSLTIPPLRERREDIRELVYSYVGYLTPRIGKRIDCISDGVMRSLESYDWPGNVRELINVVERAMLLSPGQEITLRELPEEISQLVPLLSDTDSLISGAKLSIPDDWLDRPWRDLRRMALDQLERAYLAGILIRNRGRICDSAEDAGMETRSLYDKMRRLGLDKAAFKRRAS